MRIRISYSGVGIAGDTFDYRIIDRVISPILGKGSQYRSFEKLLDMPASYYHNFARWSDLCLMRSSGAVAELKRLAGASLEAEKIEKFIALDRGQRRLHALQSGLRGENAAVARGHGETCVLRRR